MQAAKIGVAQAEGNWQADKTVTDCTACHAEFSMFVRRHHCRLCLLQSFMRATLIVIRMCGLVFCNKCSSLRLQGAESGKRVCSSCFERARLVKAQNLALPAAGIATASLAFEEENVTPDSRFRSVSSAKPDGS